MALEDFLTTDDPLGPIRHERILRRRSTEEKDSDPMNILIYRANTFDMVLKETHPIVMGRRGAGKTAIVAALLARSGRSQYYYTRDDSPNECDDTYVFIQSWDHLDELVNHVGLDCLHSLGGQPLWDDLLPETACRFWVRRIWNVIFQQLYNDSFSDYTTFDYRMHLPELFSYIEGSDIISFSSVLNNDLLNQAFENTRNAVLSFFARNSLKCFVIIDSLDHYPVNSLRFRHIVGGLLR